jgi:hypothetical protein
MATGNIRTLGHEKLRELTRKTLRMVGKHISEGRIRQKFYPAFLRSSVLKIFLAEIQNRGGDDRE